MDDRILIKNAVLAVMEALTAVAQKYLVEKLVHPSGISLQRSW